MVRGKAIDIIKTFSADELREFSAFLDSPYFNKKKKVADLYSIIESNLKRIDNNDCNEEELFAGIFEDGKFSYSFLKNLMSELLKQCEKFLIVSRLKSGDFSDDISGRILLGELNRRFLDKQFALKLKDIRKELSNRKYEPDYFETLSKIESENIAYFLYRSSMQNVPEHLMKRVENNFILILHLLEHDLMDISVNEAAFNLNFEDAIVPDLIDCIDFKKMLKALSQHKGPVKEEIEIHLRMIIVGNGKPDDENYYRLKALLLPGIERYTNSEKLNMFIRLKNYCAFRIYGGERSFFKEKYLLLKEELETVKYNQDGVGPLLTNVFLEGVQSAINEGEVEYAEKLIREFSGSLEIAKRKDVTNLAKALLNFERKKFEESLEMLSSATAFNLMMKLTSKMLLIKIFYELNEEQSGYSALESFRHFLESSKEITGARRKNLKWNHSILKRLYQAKFDEKRLSEQEAQTLKKEIANSETRYAGWYLEKVKEHQGD